MKRPPPSSPVSRSPPHSSSADAAPATQTTSPVDAETSAVPAASSCGAIAELSYADLDIDDANLSFDTADAVDVTLANGASAGGSGVEVDGDPVTITEAGTYSVSGTLSSGSLVVDASDGIVNLVLDGVDITAADVAAINVVNAGQVVVWLADGSENSWPTRADAVIDEAVEDAPNATLFSTADLWIAGDGGLSVTAHAADAITSKDTLVLAGGDVAVAAADDGVRGKDHLVITGGTLEADVEGDALRSDNESVADDPDAAVGVVWIDGGTLDLTSGSDAVDAARQVTVPSGDVTIAAGDDGLHSDGVLRIEGGNVTITESVEGIEGAYMYLSGGRCVRRCHRRRHQRGSRRLRDRASPHGSPCRPGHRLDPAPPRVPRRGDGPRMARQVDTRRIAGAMGGPAEPVRRDRPGGRPRVARCVRDAGHRLRRPRGGRQRHQVPGGQRWDLCAGHDERWRGRQRIHDHDRRHNRDLEHGRRPQRRPRCGRHVNRLWRHARSERHVRHGGRTRG